jgi:hypothetical protein
MQQQIAFPDRYQHQSILEIPPLQDQLWFVIGKKELGYENPKSPQSSHNRRGRNDWNRRYWWRSPRPWRRAYGRRVPRSRAIHGWHNFNAADLQSV